MNLTNDWRDTADSVKDKLKFTLTNENTHQDVIIIVGNGSSETVVKVHSFMLILGSQVFEKLLETAEVNNEGFKEIKMPYVRPEALRFVLKYIYTDCVNMEAENALDILYVSLKLSLRRLSMLCVSKLRGEISVQNVQQIFEEAQKMDVQELVQTSQDYILKNARDVFEREQFLNISKENLCKLLVSDELEMDEVSLFKFILRWGEAECQRLNRENNRENLRFVLETVLPLIRYPLMTFHQFATVVVETNLLDCNEVIDVYNYLSVINSHTDRDIEPPQWIFSSAVRKFTIGEHSMVSANNESEKNSDDCVAQHDEPENTTKERLLKYLQKIKQTKTICGLYCIDPADTGIQTIENITGVQPGILTLRMPSYLDRAVDWQSFVKEIISHWNNGYLIHIKWWSDLPKNLKGSKTSDETVWQDLIKDNGQLNQEWKNQLDVVAPYFKQLQNAGVVVICYLLPLINHKYGLCSGRPGNNGSIKLHQITYDYLTTVHDLKKSILWTWSLYIDGDMKNLEEYWPGNNYVDIASVCILHKKQAEIKVYHKLLELVGNKPISMECMYTAPTPQLLADQPGWTWFTVRDDLLKQPAYNNDQSIKTIFNSPSVISKGNNEFFKTSQSTFDEQTQVHTVD